MTNGKGGDRAGQVFFGLILMAAGVVLWLDQLDVIEMRSVFRYWPLVMVFFGISSIIAPREKRDVGGGASMIVIGLWVLACTRDWYGLSFSNSWPVIAVAIGAGMIFGSLFPSASKSTIKVGVVKKFGVGKDDDEKEPNRA
ncbi:MAG TPA: DUF5668 domain-containing protein [Candidatus Eisenbacteria bacterium]|nr:DUF5668 domain-containing protein [Candidatus Eisenbacteria bacterium]